MSSVFYRAHFISRRARKIAHCRKKLSLKNKKFPFKENFLARRAYLFSSSTNFFLPLYPKINDRKTMEYISQECYDKLTAELHELLTVERPRIAEAISEARDKGDLSENFEYHAAKREQGKLEGRIDRLRVKLSNARIIERSRLNNDSVQLFSTVELTDLTHNRKMAYTIVNPTESDFSSGKISVKTPIAQGLLKKHVGDVVEIHVPAGLLQLRIDKISVM